MRKEKKQIILESLTITDTTSDGRSVARLDGKVIFVEKAVPGDVADVLLFKNKKSFAEGKAINIVIPSDKRADAFCSHFGVCGGCKWQSMDYTWQLHFKQKQVEDALQRIGGLELPEISPIKASEKTTYYRNKLEYTFSNKRWLTQAEIGSVTEHENALGFHIPQRFDKILDIKQCFLQPDPSDAIRLAVKEHAEAHKLEYFDLISQQGFLRNLMIRTSSSGQLMVVVVFFRENKEQREALLEVLDNKFPQITSLQYVINEKKNDTLFDQNCILYKGSDHIIEEMEGLNFKVGAKTFFQTNSTQALELYRLTRNFAELKGHELVYDLYTGTGTIACFVASKAKHVIGIDYIPESIENAKENAIANKIENCSFFAGDMGKTLTSEFIQEHGRADVVITDPPRSGMNPDVVARLIEMRPEKIVYVSCNPATQARDLALLAEHYTIEKVQPVDMFPHTHHVENIVLLRVKS